MSQVGRYVMMDVDESELVLRSVSNRLPTHGAVRIKISKGARETLLATISPKIPSQDLPKGDVSLEAVKMLIVFV